MAANRLYLGDCLEAMREAIADRSVDLIYLDPPFNSGRLYSASIGAGRWLAFDDTWRWDDAVADFNAVASDARLADTMEGLRRMLGEGPSLAYLSYMANRLRECRRILKPAGSAYLHCDPTMSHYLKALMDGLFCRGRAGGAFINEIVWCYRTGGVSERRWGRKHDVLLLYGKSKTPFFRPVMEKSYLSHAYGYGNVEILKDDVGPYRLTYGRDWWNIDALRGNQKESLGYPTQKPLKLLDRIIRASCPEKGVVFDPFCGCGTTLHAAQELGRSWIGIEACAEACKIVETRIRTHFDGLWDDVEFIPMAETTRRRRAPDRP